MAYTFFMGEAANRDQVHLTRYCGPESRDGSRHCLQMDTMRYKESANCPYDRRERPVLEGWSRVLLTRDEAIVLRDQLSRFIEGVRDGAQVENFGTQRRRDARGA